MNPIALKREGKGPKRLQLSMTGPAPFDCLPFDKLRTRRSGRADIKAGDIAVTPRSRFARPFGSRGQVGDIEVFNPWAALDLSVIV